MSNFPLDPVIQRIEESTKMSIVDFLLLGNTWNFIEIGGDISAFEWTRAEFDYEKLFAGVFELQDCDFRLAIRLGNVAGCELVLFVTSTGNYPSQGADINDRHTEVDIERLIDHLRRAFHEVVAETSSDTQVSFELNGPSGMRIFPSDWVNLGDAFGRRLLSPEFFAEGIYPRGSRAYFAARKMGFNEEWDTASDLSSKLLPRLKPHHAMRKYVRIAVDHVLEDGHLWFPEKHVDTDICQAVNVGLLNGCSNRYYKRLIADGPIVALQQTYQLFEDQFATTWFFRTPSVANQLLNHLARTLVAKEGEDRSSTLKEIDELRSKVDSVERAVEHAFSPGRNHASRTILVYAEDYSHSWRMADLYYNAELAARRFAVRYKMLSGHNYNVTPLQPYVQSLLEITRKLFQTIRKGIEDFREFVVQPRSEEEHEIEKVGELVSETAADIYVSESLLCRTLIGRFVDSSRPILEPYLEMNRMTDVGLCDWPFGDDGIWWNEGIGKLCTSVKIIELLPAVTTIFADYCHRSKILGGSCSGTGVSKSSVSSGSDSEEGGIRFNVGDCGGGNDVFGGPLSLLPQMPASGMFPELPISFVPLPNFGAMQMQSGYHGLPLEPNVIIQHAAQRSIVKENGELVFIRTVSGTFQNACRNNNDRSNSERPVVIEEIADEEGDRVAGVVELCGASSSPDATQRGSSSDPTYDEVTVEALSTEADDDISSTSNCCFSSFLKLLPRKHCRKEVQKSSREKKKGLFRRACFSVLKKLCCI